tara:strand:+ start:76 stop:816 length:741 start_codon:yes stop_codon:yes gene_type:complete
MPTNVTRRRKSPIRTSSRVMQENLALATLKRYTKKYKNYNECSICFKKMNKDSIDNFSCCNHKNHFHKNCMLKWLETDTNLSCPLCRREVNLDENAKKIITTVNKMHEKNLYRIFQDIILFINSHDEKSLLLEIPNLKHKIDLLMKSIQIIESLYNAPNNIIQLLNKFDFQTVYNNYIGYHIVVITNIVEEFYNIIDKTKAKKRLKGLLSDKDLGLIRSRNSIDKRNNSAPSNIALMNNIKKEVSH